MYFGAGTSKLQHALKTLHAHWDATQEGWRDQVRHDFEERTLAPLQSMASQTARAMDDLADLFAKIYRDCS